MSWRIHWVRVTHIYICVIKRRHHWFRWWLVAWPVPRHYLNQWWNIVNWTLGNKFQWNFHQNTTIFIHVFENVVCGMVSILYRPQYIKPSSLDHGDNANAYDSISLLHHWTPPPWKYQRWEKSTLKQVALIPMIVYIFYCRQTSNIRHTLIGNKFWSLRCSWSIACRRCSNSFSIST